MEVKVLSSVEEIFDRRKDYFIIGTHNGVFHCDEIVACAILCLSYEKTQPICIIRTRNEKELEQCDICVDIGGGKYDHHHSGFNEKRENGSLYASAGLVWRSYGDSIIANELSLFHSPESFPYRDDLFSIFDDTVISLVDNEDNGKQSKPHSFMFIPLFLPTWDEPIHDFNSQFKKALDITIIVLHQQLKHSISSFLAKNIIEVRYRNVEYFSNHILEVPCQSDIWFDEIIRINSIISVFPILEDNIINFIIFPYPDGGWAAQCVPPSFEEKFKQLVPFPRSWAGKTFTLAKISGVESATFCHNNCFFVRATLKEDVIELCKLAMKDRDKK